MQDLVEFQFRVEMYMAMVGLFPSFRGAITHPSNPAHPDPIPTPNPTRTPPSWARLYIFPVPRCANWRPFSGFRGFGVSGFRSFRGFGVSGFWSFRGVGGFVGEVGRWEGWEVIYS